MKRLLAFTVAVGVQASTCSSHGSSVGSPIHLKHITIDTSRRGRVPAVCRPTARNTGLFAVQFDSPVSSEERQRLEGAGARVLGYLPPNSYLVEASPEVIHSIDQWPEVRWSGEYLPEYKLEKRALRRTRWSKRLLGEEPIETYEPVSVLILVPNPADAGTVAAVVAGGGGRVERIEKSARHAWIRAAVPTGLLESLAARSDVQWIEEARPIKLCNDVAVQSGRMDVTVVWTNWGLTGRDQIIGHADTGLDTGNLDTIHTDFWGRVIAAYAWGRPYQYLVASHEPLAGPSTIALLVGVDGGWDACRIEVDTTAVARVVQMMISRSASSAAQGTMVCRIYDDDGGEPGSLLPGAVSEPLDAVYVTTNASDWQTFQFTNQITLTSGSPYWLVLDCSAVTAGTLYAGYSTTLTKYYHARTMNGGTNWFTEKRWFYHRVGGPPDWSDPHGHGTHTAGSILGDGSASTGRYRGVAYEGKLVHQSVMDSDGGLGGVPADLTRLFLQAYLDGARIHSDSWGSAVEGAYDAYASQLDTFVWDHPEMLVVVSVGNDGADHEAPLGVVDEDSLYSPGTAKNGLTVGASENLRPEKTNTYRSGFFDFDFPFAPISTDRMANCSWGMAAFSSRGPCDDGRIKPDVVAPGTFVISCRSHHPDAGDGWEALDSNYVYRGGTSMSAPLCAGAAALVRQFYIERKGLTNPSAALIKATLVNGAQSMSPGQYGEGDKREIPASHPNNVEGWGRINLEEALFPSNGRRVIYFEGAALDTGQTNTFYVGMLSTGKLAVTLVYSDYPGTPGVATCLVNDLDLVVISPSGSNYYPNGQSGPDRLNPVENVDVTGYSGRWILRVAGHNVPFGPQPFALVVSGDIAPVVYCNAEMPAAGLISMEWDTQRDFRYSVEQAQELNGSWQEVPGQTNLPGTGGALTVTNGLGSAARGFFRVVTRPDI